MMRHYAAPALLGLLIAFPAPARAQSGAWRDRGYVTISGWYQPVGTTFNDEIQPIIDVEAADVDTELRHRFGSRASTSAAACASGATSRIGVNVSRFSKNEQRHRRRTSATPVLLQTAAHGDGRGGRRWRATKPRCTSRLLWMVPLRERLAARDCPADRRGSMSGRISSTDVAVTQTYPFDTATFASATSSRQTGTHAGFNAAADRHLHPAAARRRRAWK